MIDINHPLPIYSRLHYSSVASAAPQSPSAPFNAIIPHHSRGPPFTMSSSSPWRWWGSSTLASAKKQEGLLQHPNTPPWLILTVSLGRAVSCCPMQDPFEVWWDEEAWYELQSLHGCLRGQSLNQGLVGFWPPSLQPQLPHACLRRLPQLSQSIGARRARSMSPRRPGMSSTATASMCAQAAVSHPPSCAE